MSEIVYALRKKGTTFLFVEYVLEVQETVEVCYEALRYAVMFDTKDEALAFANQYKISVEVVPIRIEVIE